jgi:hypothetical protein
MNAFIRGIFGDHEIAKWPKIIVDAVTNVNGRHHPPKIETYCYGKVNSSILNWLRVGYRVLSNDPVQQWEFAGEKRSPSSSGMAKSRGMVNYGVSIWRHKLEIIHTALQERKAVVWLDWDCWQIKKLPRVFWKWMHQGQPLQCSMLKFMKPKVPGREGAAACYSPHGAFIYCRDIKIIDELLALSQQHPTYYDETLIALWIEQHWGRPWQDGDDQRWVNEGWEPFAGCYRTRHQVRPNAQAYFREGCK